MLAVQGLAKKFGDVAAVDDIGFEARAGSVFGLLGPNGAGKSTTIDCVSGLLAPSSGRISVGGVGIAIVLGGWRRGISGPGKFGKQGDTWLDSNARQPPQ